MELKRQVHIGSPQDGSLSHTNLKRFRSLLTGFKSVTPLSLKLESYLKEKGLGRRVGVLRIQTSRMNDSENNSARFIVAVLSHAGHYSSVFNRVKDYTLRLPQS
jgi:hypothetical protein